MWLWCYWNKFYILFLAPLSHKSIKPISHDFYGVHIRIWFCFLHSSDDWLSYSSARHGLENFNVLIFSCNEKKSFTVRNTTTNLTFCTHVETARSETTVLVQTTPNKVLEIPPRLMKMWPCQYISKHLDVIC